MQTVQWFGFGVCNSLTRTVVHFFPSAGGVSAPYQAMCQLSVFGPNMPRKTVMLEGVRLSQPDGVRIEDAFPGLQVDSSGFFGLEITVGTNQPRVELHKSGCTIELVSQLHSVRFSPKFLSNPESENRSSRSLPWIKDSFHQTSFIAVNAADEARPIELFLPKVSGAELEATLLLKRELTGQSAVEIDPPSAAIDATSPREMSWGLVRAESVLVREDLSPDVALFALYRETQNRRPVSVCAL